MGDLRDWLADPEMSAPAPEDRSAGVGDEYWNRAEDATQGIIAQVQPKVVSEKRRRAVIDFVQRLLKGYLGCEVFPFGSVPLKTYLPDGDIDLTAFGGINVEEALANDVCSVLEREEQNNAAEFVVKDVQLIRAEVKLVKCLVQNIVVDISFNQLGGLCTLCFLEQVDCLIGKDHLFKRSVILIKAWCYYESRILGAHHGLISTYALETLVLYIFHLFHSSLNGPLAVLYKFLDYFSSFDWDNYCISLNGPVRISCLPQLIAEVPESSGHGLLLSDDFLRECVEMFSAPSRGYEAASRTFSPKHLNIVDPLKENNNLGRSVSKGNFFRIRSAFSFGARKLRRILSLPEENIVDEIQNFFSNTMERHGKGQRPDVQDPLSMSRYDDFGAHPFSSDTESPEIQAVHEANHTSRSAWECGPHHRGLPNGGVADAEISETEELRSDHSMNGNAITDNRLNGDAKDLATLRLKNLTIDIPKESSPRQYSPHPSLGNGEMKYDDQTKNREIYDSLEINVASDQEENRSVHNHKDLSSIISSAEDYHPGYSEPCHTLSDLSGDYESHLSSLQYGRWCYDCASSPPVHPVPPLLALHKKRSWEFIRRSLQLKHHMFSQINPNGIVHRPPFFHLGPPLLPGGGGFGLEEMPKPRGTGTYIPNMNHYRDKPLTPRGRNQSQLRSPRNNGRSVIPPPENSFLERNNREVAAQMTISPHNGSRGKSASFDDLYCSPRRMAEHNVNGFLHVAEHFVEPGPIGQLPPEPPLLRGSWQASLGSSPVQNPSASLPMPGSENLKPPPLSLDTDRVDVQSYRLKDEDDFPPLSI